MSIPFSLFATMVLTAMPPRQLLMQRNIPTNVSFFSQAFMFTGMAALLEAIENTCIMAGAADTRQPGS